MLCNKPLKYYGTAKTLVGYFSKPDHNHDDNCHFKVFKCEVGHQIYVPIIAKCDNPDCDWIGKLVCFCHKSEKVEPDSIEANPTVCTKEIKND